jgi:AraC-like DNA-binding protein
MADLVKFISPDPDKVQMLASFGCSIVEIAKYFKMDESTVRKNYKDELETGRESLKVKLRQLQWDHAARGNTALLIWLGKQYLGQTDRKEIDLIGNLESVLKECGFEDSPIDAEYSVEEEDTEQAEAVESRRLPANKDSA